MSYGIAGCRMMAFQDENIVEQSIGRESRHHQCYLFMWPKQDHLSLIYSENVYWNNVQLKQARISKRLINVL